MEQKLAVSTLAFQNWELEDAIAVCKENGIGALELRMGFHPWSRLDLPDSVYERNYEIIRSQGLKVSDLGTSVHMMGCRPESLKELERCSQIANIMECQGLRIMFGNKRRFWSEPKPEIDYEELATWLRAADDIAGQFKTQIWIENHDEFSGGKMLRELLDRYPFRHVRLIWDIIHSLEADETPEETLTYMGKDLVHIHVKDGRPWENPDCSQWKHTRIGEGAVPLKQVVDLVQKTGYDGYFSLEWESPWREEIRGEGYEIPKMIRDFVEVMK